MTAILVVMPVYDRLVDESLRSVLTQVLPDGVVMDIFMPYMGYGCGTKDSRYTIRDKYNEARDKFLQGSYDYMWTMESDMVAPPDALEELLSVEADVAYGLYAFRRHPFDWNAYIEMDEANMLGFPLSGIPKRAQAALQGGEVLRTDGVGLGCTLIHRKVLERVPFAIYEDKQHGAGTEAVHFSHCDWYFALDTKDKFDCRVHCGVVLGHITDAPAPATIYPVAQGLQGNLQRHVPYGDVLRHIDDQSIAERYREWLCTPHDMLGHMETLRTESRGVVVELGCRYGASTTAFLAGEAIEVHSVDMKTCPHSHNDTRWHFHKQESTDTTGLPGCVDVLLVDTLHTYEQVRDELRVWVPRMNAGGTVLFHDTELPDVRRAIEDYCPHPVEFHAHSYGLGIARLP
jgi:hypothetical protein